MILLYRCLYVFLSAEKVCVRFIVSSFLAGTGVERVRGVLMLEFFDPF